MKYHSRIPNLNPNLKEATYKGGWGTGKSITGWKNHPNEAFLALQTMLTIPGSLLELRLLSLISKKEEKKTMRLSIAEDRGVNDFDDDDFPKGEEIG